MVRESVDEALGHYNQMSDDIARMEATPCHEQRGHALLGVAIGKGLLTPNQASVAFGDWAKARHEAFADRNVWSLYNAVTEGLKKGGPSTVIERHAAAHDFFVDVVN